MDLDPLARSLRDDVQVTSNDYSGISASGHARQHNGNITNSV